MTVPPYVVGCVVVLVVAYLSDHYKRRVWGLIGAMLLCIIGLTMTLALPAENVHGRYGGLILLVSGSFIGSPLQIAWLSQNTPEPGQRVVALGINGWGTVAGLIGSQIFQAKYKPLYRLPLAITLGLVSLALVLFGLNAVICVAINRRRAKIVANMTPDEIEEENNSNTRYGDKKYTFVYGW